MLFLQIYKKGVLFFVETMNYSGSENAIYWAQKLKDKDRPVAGLL